MNTTTASNDGHETLEGTKKTTEHGTDADRKKQEAGSRRKPPSGPCDGCDHTRVRETQELGTWRKGSAGWGDANVNVNASADAIVDG